MPFPKLIPPTYYADTPLKKTPKKPSIIQVTSQPTGVVALRPTGLVTDLHVILSVAYLVVVTSSTDALVDLTPICTPEVTP